MGRLAADPQEPLLAARSTAETPVFDQIAAMAAHALAAPMGFVSIVEAGAQTFIGAFGWPIASLRGGEIIGAESLRSGLPGSVADTHAVAELSGASVVAGPPHVRWFAVAPVLDGSGRAIGAVGAIDRIARAAADRGGLAALAELSKLVALQLDALSAVRARLTDFIETSADWMWESDREHRFTFMSPQQMVVFPGRIGEVIGRRRWELLNLEEPESVWRTHRAQLDSHLPFRGFEYRCRDHENRLRFVSVSGRPVLSATGEFLGYRGTARDLTAQRESEARAHERDMIFRQIVETTREGVWLVDADGRTVLVNQRMAEICGRTPGEMVARPFFDFLPAEMRAESERLWKNRRRGVSEQHEMLFVRPDGSEVLGLMTATPQFDEHGAFSGAVALVADISALKQTEMALKRSEAELQRAQRMAHLGHWTWKPHPDATTRWRGTSIYSPAGAAIFGVTPDELNIPSDEYIKRFVHPSDREMVSRTLIESGGPVGDGYTLEYRILRADGETRIIREIAELVRDKDGTYLHTIGALQDVTESRHAEAALRESENRFRMIADTMPNLLWLADADARITFLNRRWEEYTGTPNHLNIGRLWTLDAHPDDIARVGLPFQDKGTSIDHFEVRLRDRDGTYRWFLDTFAQRWSDTGEFLGYIGTLTDIDDMRRLNEQLYQAQKMEAVGQLTGGIAHDFNNLLTVILGNAELLEERMTDPALLRLAVATRGAAERSAALVRRLLAFSRRQALQPVLTDVNELIGDMRELLERTLGEAIEVEVVAAPSLPRVTVDPAQLESAILNLAINARDAMPDGGRLMIETATAHLDAGYAAAETEVAPGDYVMIAVNDSGAGMTEEVQRHAFEPFFTTKDTGRGSGLGLSMVYGFIKQSGGHIKLYSELGQGTSVKMYLPRSADAQDDARPAGRRTSQDTSRGRNEKILVVEDDDRVREFVVEQLMSLGYRVVAARSGSQALDLLATERDIDLLFTDVVMQGGMNGRELADAAVERRPGLKVLYTTGYTRDAIVHHGRLDPGVALLSKPYPRHELARKLRTVLDR